MSQYLPRLCRALVFALVLTIAPRLHAQNLYWVGTGGTAATAGGGTWDANTSLTWRDTTPTGTLVKWTQNRTAIFTGSAGGPVAANDLLNIAALQFEAAAGAFTITSSGLLTISGAGISSASSATQTLNLSQGILNFTNNASAASGSQAARVKITSDGQISFNGTSTAGAVDLTSSSDVLFGENSSAGTAKIASTGQVSFAGSASASAATITNDGLLTFDENAAAGAATITNRGQFSISGNAHTFNTASVNNGALGVIDLAGSTAVNGVTFGSLTNAADSTLNLGSARLKAATVSLTDGNAISFNLGPSGTGLLEITGSFLGNATAAGTSITIIDTGGISAGRIVPLLDWSAAGTVQGVQATDFMLQPLPGGFAGTLRIEGSTLVLEVLPEPGTALLALSGMLPRAVLRRRR